MLIQTIVSLCLENLLLSFNSEHLGFAYYWSTGLKNKYPQSYKAKEKEKENGESSYFSVLSLSPVKTTAMWNCLNRVIKISNSYSFMLTLTFTSSKQLFSSSKQLNRADIITISSLQ